MVEPRNILIPGIAVLVSLSLIVTVGGVDLSGSQAKNLYCEIPFLSNSDQCQTFQGDETFTATFEMNVDRLDVNTVDYSTVSEDKNHLSALSSDLSTLAFPAETRDAKLEMVLRDDSGRIVGSDTEWFGTITGTDRRTASFEVGNLDSGSYTLYLEFSGEGCGLISCSEVLDTNEVNIQVPNLPLGEEKTFNLEAN